MSFAKQLREKGINAWVDKWEMLPGDSIVDRIFEEGLKEAQAVIVVLSKFSVDKPWVREELNAAVVKRINTGSKLIPVLLDDCQVPEALRSTIWERISDLGSYQPSLDRIIASIFGMSAQPPLGKPPAYTQAAVQSVGDMSKLDSLVLKLACEHALATGSNFIDCSEVYGTDCKFVIPESELRDALEILERSDYIRISRTVNTALSHFIITTHGFSVYAEYYIPGYQGLIRSVVSAVVNEHLADNLSIASALGQPRLLVDHILDEMEGKGLLTQSKRTNGVCRVGEVSVELKRWLNR